MSRIGEPMLAHHRRLYALSAALEDAARRHDWEAYRARLAALGVALENHIDFEESTLFPAFESASGTPHGLTEELRTEHEELRRRLATLSAAAPSRDPEGCRDELRTLLAVLAPHIAKEESGLYPACERLPDPQLDALARGARRLNGPADAPDSAELDVRNLDPPEPMLRIVERLRRAPGQALRVRIHREPFPLYDLLREQGYAWQTRALEDGSFEILIERSAHGGAGAS